MKKRLFNTKKKLVILSVMALSMGMTSCADWLEMPSYTSADSETVFKNEEAAELFVTGCYRGIIPTEMVYQLRSRMLHCLGVCRMPDSTVGVVGFRSTVLL